MRLTSRLARTFAAVSLCVFGAAHVGSPNAYYSGNAGPYAVDVVVRPPNVVPGLADVLVHVREAGVRRVVIRPVFWRVGTRGSPPGDDAKLVPGSDRDYEGQLWMMAAGAYAVDVTVHGTKGQGAVSVPTVAVATGQLALSGGLRALLIVLGVLLVAGVITAVHAAVGESQVPPGQSPSSEQRRKARRATLIAIPVLVFIVFGGARWWSAEADDYRRTLYRPVATHAELSDSSGIPLIRLNVLERSWSNGGVTPLMPDHGKLAHLFVIGIDSPYVLAHLHPQMPDRATFVSPLPPLPKGRYRVFADVVHESGFERTLVDSLTLLHAVGNAGTSRLTADDAWSDGDASTLSDAHRPSTAHSDDSLVHWGGPARVTANQPGVLQFRLSRNDTAAVVVVPYLGMAGHAIVVREDGKVFIHLHPSGTTTMASQLALELRNRGDTTRKGRLNLSAIPPMPMLAAAESLKSISFPYAFPSAGRYRVYVQIRVDGKVHTSTFDVPVYDDPAVH